jgi:hypothetical protein
MKWVIRIVVALFFCFVFFGAIQHYLPHLEAWISVVLAVIGAVFTTLLASLEFLKKWYDALKAPYELRKLKREEEAAEKEKISLIRSPSADELRRHGQSVVEQTLDKRFRKAGADPLNARPFIIDPNEKK